MRVVVWILYAPILSYRPGSLAGLHLPRYVVVSPPVEPTCCIMGVLWSQCIMGVVVWLGSLAHRWKLGAWGTWTTTPMRHCNPTGKYSVMLNWLEMKCVSSIQQIKMKCFTFGMSKCLFDQRCLNATSPFPKLNFLEFHILWEISMFIFCSSLGWKQILAFLTGWNSDVFTPL